MGESVMIRIEREANPPRHGEPHADWLLGRGADFAIRNREARIGSRNDFGYNFLIRSFASGAAAPAYTRTVLEPLLPGEIPSPQDGELLNQMLLPCPLQEDSIRGTGPLAATAGAAYTPPPELAALSDEDKRRLVVVAVIDDGANIAHRRFQCADGSSRVDYAWIQDGPRRTDGVDFGTEWTGAEITQAIRHHGEDESEVMRALNLLDFARPGVTVLGRRASHGTHMTDNAAGMDPEDPEAHLRRIITVQLPFLMTQESSGTTYAPFVHAALVYVLRRVGAMSRALGVHVPVVVNFSYAIGAGPHDGTHFLEQRFADALAEHRHEVAAALTAAQPGGAPVDPAAQDPKAVLVLPAGNRNLARGHAESEAGAATPLTLPWRVQPGDQTSSYLEIWMPEAAGDVRIEVTPPGSAPLVMTGLDGGPPRLLKDQDGSTIGRISLDRPFTLGGGVQKKRILIALAPTDLSFLETVTRNPAPSGLWQVTASCDLEPEERIQAWIQRDESPYQYRGNARQSYFDDPGYTRFDQYGYPLEIDDGGSHVKRAGSLSGIATSDQIVVVAGVFGAADPEHMEPDAVTDRDGQAVPYSAAGSDGVFALEGKGDWDVRGPDVGAPSDRSYLRPGRLHAGTRSGSTVAMTGSSVAAPTVSRTIADQFSSGGLTSASALFTAARTAQGTALAAMADPPSDANRQAARRGLTELFPPA